MTTHEDVGYLTWDEFKSFRWAVHYSLRLVPWLRVAGHIRGEASEVRAPSSDPPMNLAATWIAAEEIDRLSRELSVWPNLEDVAADHFGVTVARWFTREVQTAAHRWPFEDRARRVQYLRCQACTADALQYSPPEFEGDASGIGCVECGATMTDDEFRVLAAMVAADIRKGSGDVGVGGLGAA